MDCKMENTIEVLVCNGQDWRMKKKLGGKNIPERRNKEPRDEYSLLRCCFEENFLGFLMRRMMVKVYQIQYFEQDIDMRPQYQPSIIIITRIPWSRKTTHLMIETKIQGTDHMKETNDQYKIFDTNLMDEM